MTSNFHSLSIYCSILTPLTHSTPLSQTLRHAAARSRQLASPCERIARRHAQVGRGCDCGVRRLDLHPVPTSGPPEQRKRWCFPTFASNCIPYAVRVCANHVLVSHVLPLSLFPPSPMLSRGCLRRGRSSGTWGFPRPPRAYPTQRDQAGDF